MPYEIREIISSTVNGGNCVLYTAKHVRGLSANHFKFLQVRLAQEIKCQIFTCQLQASD